MQFCASIDANGPPLTRSGLIFGEVSVAEKGLTQVTYLTVGIRLPAKLRMGLSLLVLASKGKHYGVDGEEASEMKDDAETENPRAGKISRRNKRQQTFVLKTCIRRYMTSTQVKRKVQTQFHPAERIRFHPGKGKPHRDSMEPPETPRFGGVEESPFLRTGYFDRSEDSRDESAFIASRLTGTSIRHGSDDWTIHSDRA